MPFATVPVIAAAEPAPQITLAQALAAVRDLMDIAVPAGHGWHLTMGQELDGACHEEIIEIIPIVPVRRTILSADAWA